jgi:hypothetical protein
MVERPTTKQIDQWLAGIASRTPMHSPESEEMVIGLAAEVRALQAELSDYQDAVKTWSANVRDRVAERDALREALSRVEALKPTWLSRSRALRIMRSEIARGSSVAIQACADEIEAALRGENHG